MIINKTVFTSTLGAVLMVSIISMPSPAQAGSSAGAFVGGMLAGHVVRNMHDRTQAEQQQAYYAQQQARQPVQQASSSQSTQQQLAKLDKLAEGGYITPAEYKAKRKTVLDNM